MEVFASVFNCFVRLFIFDANIQEYFTIQCLLLVYDVDIRVISHNVILFHIKMTLKKTR